MATSAAVIPPRKKNRGRSNTARAVVPSNLEITANNLEEMFEIGTPHSELNEKVSALLSRAREKGDMRAFGKAQRLQRRLMNEARQAQSTPRHASDADQTGATPEAQKPDKPLADYAAAQELRRELTDALLNTRLALDLQMDDVIEDRLKNRVDDDQVRLHDLYTYKNVLETATLMLNTAIDTNDPQRIAAATRKARGLVAHKKRELGHGEESATRILPEIVRKRAHELPTVGKQQQNAAKSEPQRA